MSLDEPEPVDSVLTFPSGYDTLEYSWVKATAVSVRLRILFVTLQNTNTCREGGAAPPPAVTPQRNSAASPWERERGEETEAQPPLRLEEGEETEKREGEGKNKP